MGLNSAENILETVGRTPVIHLWANSNQGASLFAKYEAANPSYSIKDRIALAMIEHGIQKGEIKPTTHIVTGTSGNTGVALAMVCVVNHLKLTIFMPEDASLERRKMLQGFGVDLKVTPHKEGIEGAIRKASDFAKKNKAYLLDQFDHPANAEAHGQTTALEIVDDFPEGIDAFVAGIGTGGTISGVGAVLKKRFPSVKVYAVEPAASPVLSGGKKGKHRIQQLGVGFIPKNLRRDLIDQVLTVSDEEAYETTRRLSYEQGILVGISSGANVACALKVANTLNKKATVLTILADAGQRYFSLEKFFLCRT